MGLVEIKEFKNEIKSGKLHMISKLISAMKNFSFLVIYYLLICIDEILQYDCIGEANKPIRLVDEFLYKLILRNCEEDHIGYEFYKLQHKNMLRNKL